MKVKTNLRVTKYVALFVSSALTVVGVGLAGSGSVSAASKKTMAPAHVTAFWSETGASEVFGQGEAAGANFAVSSVNASGGIGGHKVDLTVINDNTDPSTALSSLRGVLSNKNNLAILGPTNSGVSDAIEPSVSKAKMPMLSIAGDPFLTNPLRPTVFRAFTNSNNSAATIMAFLKTKNIQSVAIIFSQDSFGISGSTAAEQAAVAAGITVSAVEGYPDSATDYTSEIITAAAQKPGAYILWDGSTRMSTLLTDMANEGLSSTTTPFIGPPQIGAAATIAAAGDAATQGAYFQSQLCPGQPRAGAQSTFVNAWTKAFGTGPASPNELGYSAAVTLFAAMKNVVKAKEPLTRANVANALNHLKNFAAPEANITYTTKNHEGYGVSQVQLCEIKNGQTSIAYQ